MAEISQRRFFTGEASLSLREAGPEQGRPVLLLHGFPESWFGWLSQIAPLAAAGFRVVAPDQRGYGDSDKPVGVEAYHLDRLAADVAALANSFGRPVDLVGHDWGGLVAWWTAVRHPDCVRRLAALNAPHPAIARGYLRRHPGQLLRSWYVGFFQAPLLPEWALRVGDHALLRRALAASAPPRLLSAAEIAAYRAAWSRPGALTGMVNWYRALGRFRAGGTVSRIRQPALILWGARDPFLQFGMAEASLRKCARGRLVRFEDAGHWLQHEAPERVNAELIAFLSEP